MLSFCQVGDAKKENNFTVIVRINVIFYTCERSNKIKHIVVLLRQFAEFCSIPVDI
jgi:hypothetical protein